MCHEWVDYTRSGVCPQEPSQGGALDWVARMLGHMTLRRLYERYGKFFRNRARAGWGTL